jgi:DNA-binding NtrC family response regulator
LNRIDDEAIFHLVQYSWPGNIRELENCVEYAVNVASTEVIQTTDLPPHLFQTEQSHRGQWDESNRDQLQLKMNELASEAIIEALNACQGDTLKASQRLGVPPSLLEEKVKSLRIR